jgi:hypothetical protein
LDFIVIDTEGRRALTEIAIINSLGKLIYEAFSQEYSEYSYPERAAKPLRTILADFKAIAEGKILVFHKIHQY